MKTAMLVGLLLLVVLALGGCVAGPNPQANTPDEQGHVAGFWQGLWHGAIAPVAFVISLFTDKVHVFEVHNNGNGYVLGFLLGLMASRGGGGRRSSRQPKSG